MIGKTNALTLSGGEADKKYLVQVIDYDGTVLKSESLHAGDVFTLPTPPTHNRLTFQEWASPVDITNGTVTAIEGELVIGAVYTTVSGYTEFDIELTSGTGLTVNFMMGQTSGVTVNWGDDDVNPTITSDGTTSFTYTNYGKYTIKCDGTSIPASVMGQSSNAADGKLLNLFVSSDVTLIDEDAFYRCWSLGTVVIPNGVLSIAKNAFSNNARISGVIIPSSVTTIGESAFSGCYNSYLVIPRGVTSLGKQAFAYAYGLKSIVIPATVQTIDTHTFYRSSTIKNATLMEGITSISTNMFSMCNSLESITIPSSVTNIGVSAFGQCYSLENVVIKSENITSLGESAFASCYSLRSITMPETMQSKYLNNAFNGCYSLININIPNGIQQITTKAFYLCYSLESVTIPNTVTTIYTDSFNQCSALKEVIIPSSVSFLGTTAFYNCRSMKKVVFEGSAPNLIQQNIFQTCLSCLLYDFSNSTYVPSLNYTNVFSGINEACKIVVPDNLYSTWISDSNWATYADYIYKASEVTL